MDHPVNLSSATHRIFRHHLYEYRKGVRQLFMMTIRSVEAELIVDQLQSASIDHHLHEVSADKVNLFFGRPALVETVRSVVNKPLNLLSPEEDFILGTLLGYDREQQCLRFLARCRR
jgi:hypothetical protein